MKTQNPSIFKKKLLRKETKYKVKVVSTKYWRPGENYLDEIIKSVKGKITVGDFIVLSEKAISTALNNIVDEKKITSSFSSNFIAKYWMRIVWGYFLGSLCHFRKNLLQWLREYPLELGSQHKQVVLQYNGLLQALMFGSEGGIDGSNLAYSYVSLSLNNAEKIAQQIHEKIFENLGKKVYVVISDTDKTYSFRNFHFTPHPNPIKGITSWGGIISYILGRICKFKRRATPIAFAGGNISTEKVLKLAEIANKKRGAGAGKTVWDMAEKFQVALTEVTWEMLETIKHKPIIIIRRKEKG
jgi:F420-0:gamma-glutamyl ligase-like protein